jgi:hypothetical protein
MILLLMKYSSRTSHTLISLANGTSRTLMNPPFVNGRYIDQWELPLMNGRLPLVNGSYWRTGGTRSWVEFVLASVGWSVSAVVYKLVIVIMWPEASVVAMVETPVCVVISRVWVIV